MGELERRVPTSGPGEKRVPRSDPLFLEVLDLIPPPITENLPGLMVVDEDLTWLRSEIEYRKEYGSAAFNRYDGRKWMEESEQLLQGREAAERTYG
jgi:hypothetical protein